MPSQESYRDVLLRVIDEVVTPAAALPTVAPADGEPEAAQSEGHVLKSPMVGTFYRAPTPGVERLYEWNSPRL